MINGPTTQVSPDVMDESPARTQAPQIENLKSTPSSRGTAIDSEFLKNAKYVDPVMTVPRHTILSLCRGDYVSPKILIDLEGHSTCKFETFLKTFLRLCVNGETAPTDLLDRCVTAVIPICNAHIESNKGTKRTKGKGRDYAAKIQGHLTE